MAFGEAESHFRRLLTSHSSSEWKRVVASTSSSPSSLKGKTRAPTIPELSDVLVHRKSSLAGSEIYRVTLDVPTGEEYSSLDPWKAVLATPELRQEWDPAVESASLLEMFDSRTRICKTNFTLGWPAKYVLVFVLYSTTVLTFCFSPRDAVTIARSFYDPTTLIDISTSLPRSLDEPAYLRPSPPYVRSNVTCMSLYFRFRTLLNYDM